MMRLVLSMVVFLLAGCSVFGPVKSGPSNQYMIDAVPSVHETHRNQDTLLVTTPLALPAYNTQLMAYNTYPYQIAYFANNGWADTPPNMLQALMVESLQKTHHYRAVVAPPFQGHYDRVLHTALIQLQQDFTHHPSEVHLVFEAQLVDANTNQVIASKHFVIDEVARCNDPYSGVLAANRAAAKLMAQLALFCEKH